MFAPHHTVIVFLTFAFLTDSKSTFRPGIECYSCDGPYNLCSGESREPIKKMTGRKMSQTNTQRSLWPASPTWRPAAWVEWRCLSAMRLENIRGRKIHRSFLQIIWGASCGAPTLLIATDYHCDPLELGPGVGMMCSCSTSYCNSRMGALEMIARAEYGLTGR